MGKDRCEPRRDFSARPVVHLLCNLQTHAGGQLNGLVISLLVAAIGSDLVDDLVDSGHQILVALGNYGSLAEGGFLGGELKVCDLKTAVAGGNPTA